MQPIEIMNPTLTRRRIWTARLLAVVVDAMQWVLMPLFVEGAASPAEDAVDIIIAFVMTALVGWHWSFLPALALELVPGVDLVPTWTAAVWLATHGRKPKRVESTVINPASALPIAPPPHSPS